MEEEMGHTEQSEELVERLRSPEPGRAKIYGVDYPFPSPSSNVKPQMNNDLLAAMNAGATIVHYIGHGSEDNLADEQIFRSATIPSLLNGMKRFVFIAFSCDVGVFDSPNYWSMAEQFLTSENGGAIASICASQVSYPGYNDRLSDEFYMQLYPGRRVAADLTVGSALNLAKGLMAYSGSIENSQHYNLFGDPAISLPNPPDDLEFAADSPDTLVAGQRQIIRLADGGQGTAPGDAYDLLIEESDYRRHQVVYRWEPMMRATSPIFLRTFVLPLQQGERVPGVGFPDRRPARDSRSSTRSSSATGTGPGSGRWSKRPPASGPPYVGCTRSGAGPPPATTFGGRTSGSPSPTAASGCGPVPN